MARQCDKSYEYEDDSWTVEVGEQLEKRVGGCTAS